ncbi:MAG: hypothetical protein HY675_29140 [Chloroflexi bacterium]|nr:hypothetical protein [Chloroflexota bacterium]
MSFVAVTVRSKRATQSSGVQRLDDEPYLTMFKETRQKVDEALRKYGEPKLSLAELRDALNKQMGDVSLSEQLLKDREAGF